MAKGNRQEEDTPVSVLASKYKPVALKTRPVVTGLPEQFRIRHDIRGDPLEGMPELDPKPPDFRPTGRYTQERKDDIDKVHNDDFRMSLLVYVCHYKNLIMAHSQTMNLKFLLECICGIWIL